MLVKIFFFKVEMEYRDLNCNFFFKNCSIRLSYAHFYAYVETIFENNIFL